MQTSAQDANVTSARLATLYETEISKDPFLQRALGPRAVEGTDRETSFQNACHRDSSVCFAQ